ncbi:RagB/SusD family nutrient uptake outer membrane protein [uncultured Muribaculum sp.]|uniref:RagB/SusD family nutrient uptake outer membrane protein n=1 Tax=uncultured Muribaculum sp. TaxID=1918613 RepID=UPI0025F8648C|nr:RagB/SusD family nutrient uptake outer membrane protein [uncultured Muribaculum sp.]
MRNKIYKAIALFVGAFIMTSCADMLDDIKPKDKIDANSMTEEDLSKVVNGVYATMESHMNAMWWDGDVKGENFRSGPGGNLTDPLDMSPSTSTIKSRWNNCFTSLKQVNFLIENFEGSSNKGSQVVRTAGGTGYFFRALIYYNAVTRWGKAPILRKRMYDIVPLSDEDAVWQFIIEDLGKAEELLPDFSDRFYVSKAACNALLARAYLSTRRYGEAVTCADKVIGNSSLQLMKNSVDWAKMFVYNSASKELVFALANKRTTSTILFYQYINDVDGSWSYSPAHELYAGLYSDTSVKRGDIRKDAVFSATDPTRTIKFPNELAGQFVKNETPSQTPIPVIRLAEVYLIKAEAQGASAGLPTMKDYLEARYAGVSLPSSMGDKEYQDLILDERHREFYCEGFRWYDLKRTGRLDLFKTLNGRTHLMYWPIPQAEIDLAGKENYPQNSGY